MKTTITNSLLCSLLCAGLLAGCSKEQQADEVSQPQSETAQVSFIPQIESSAEVSKAETKADETVATSPLAVGTKVKISVWRKNGIVDYLGTDKTSKIFYTTDKLYTATADALTPDDGVEVSMFKDTYAFLALSENTTTAPDLAWTNNEKAVKNLSHGKDYLGASVVNKVISGNESLALQFKHLCAKVQLAITNDPLTTEKVEVTGVTTNVVNVSGDFPKITLKTGIGGLEYYLAIGRSTFTYGPDSNILSENMVKVDGVDNTFSFIHLPTLISKDMTMEVTAKVWLKGNNTSGSHSAEKTYKLTITPGTDSVPRTLMSGQLYNYSAVISASGITFSGIPQVNDWPVVAQEVILTPTED